jgi:hypothetical protein
MFISSIGDGTSRDSPQADARIENSDRISDGQAPRAEALERASNYDL